MSLKIRFRFDGRCSVHPRFNPETDGRPPRKDCEGCESLYVIFLYTRIARSKAEAGDGLMVRQAAPREEVSSESAEDPSSLEDPTQDAV